MSEAFADDYRMTLDAFRVLTEDRPRWEKWELIDGEAFLQAEPARRHQIIVQNICLELGLLRRATGAQWQVIAGIGTRVAGDIHNEVVPDVMILPPGDDHANWTHEVFVAFEVLSPSSVRRDMVRKPAIYRRVESLTHYVVVAQDRREVTMFSRADGFLPGKLTGDVTLDIAPLGISIPIAEIYREISFS